jgi:hypothetical protein
MDGELNQNLLDMWYVPYPIFHAGVDLENDGGKVAIFLIDFLVLFLYLRSDLLFCVSWYALHLAEF